MNNEGIVAKDLVVTKQETVILRSLNFTVHPGRLTGLIGPSGAGKTTIERSIVGVEIVTSGELTINGVPAGSPQLRREIGYVTQAPSVYLDLTVEQNLKYFAALSSATNIEKVLHDVDLVPQRRQLVSTLSGGQLTRVSLAIALLGDPKILILDEPTVGLDPLLRQKLWQLFRGFADAGKTILVSSHVMDEAERCDDVFLVRDGQLLWKDSRVELLKSTGTSTVEDAFLKKVGV